MIKRFLKDVFWGRLDVLIVDTPPGTSDEHLTVLAALKVGQRCTSPPSTGPATARGARTCWHSRTGHTGRAPRRSRDRNDPAGGLSPHHPQGGTCACVCVPRVSCVPRV